MSSAANYSNLVQELYVAYFGRPADYYGLQNFETALAAANAPTDPAALATAYSTNAAVKSLVDSFGTSAESIALYGTGSTESFVNAIFENLFNRPAAVVGLTFWVDAINSGQVSKGDAALAILAGAESNTTTQGQSDWTLIQNKIAVAANFTTDLGNSSTQIVAYSGPAAAQDARLLLAGVTASTDPATYNVQTTINNIVAGNVTNTYNLTTGVDTLVGGAGNNVFNAILDNAAGLSAGGQAATLQSFDTITGGTLGNTLNITDFGTGGSTSIPGGATVTGITTLNISTLQGVSDNYSTWSGLTALNIASADGNISLTAPATATVNVVDTAGTVTIDGGSTITAKTNVSHIAVTGDAGTTSVALTGGISNTITDFNYGSGNANSITTVSLTTNGGSGSSTFTTIDSDALTSLTLIQKASGVEVNAAAGTRTLTVNLDADGPGYNGTVGAWVKDNTATTFDVNATTSASSIDFQAASATSFVFNDAVNLALTGFNAPDAKTITIEGAGNFSAAFADGSLTTVAANAAVDASGATGVVTVTLDGAGGLSFAGGTGQDVVTIGATQTGTVAGGSNTHNEIVLNNAPAATVADIAAVTHFSVFGVTGSTSGVFDMSKVSGYSAFDVQGSGGNVTFTNAAANATLSLENGNSHIVTLQTVDGNGANDTANVTLGTTTDGGNNYAQVTLEDSAFVGTATANVTMNAAKSSSQNYLGSLFDQNLVTLNLSGNANLEIGAIATDSASLTIDNETSSTGTYSVTLDNITDNHLVTLTFGGAHGLVVDALDSTSASLTIVDNSTASLWIGALHDTALASATFTNSVNTTAGTFEIGSSFAGAALATLNLNGNVQLTVSGDAVTTGITVAGSTDNAAVSFTSSAITASGSTDSITLGNGSDTVILGAGASGSTQTVVLGSGANDAFTTTSVGAVNVTVGSATTGTDSITADSALSLHVTAGNGTNVISDTAAGASTTITVGTGVNTITVGDGASGSISFGAHTTGVDAVTIGVSGTSLTAIEKISGLNNAGNDTLTFSGDANALTFTQVTAANVSSDGGDTTLLADWVKAADGDNGIVAGAAHTVTWFQFQGNTYLLESAAGQTADAGTMAAGNTLVELVGTSYTFAHATSSTTAGGVVHLVG